MHNQVAVGPEEGKIIMERIEKEGVEVEKIVQTPVVDTQETEQSIAEKSNGKTPILTIGDQNNRSTTKDAQIPITSATKDAVITQGCKSAVDANKIDVFYKENAVKDTDCNSVDE